MKPGARDRANSYSRCLMLASFEQHDSDFLKQCAYGVGNQNQTENTANYKQSWLFNHLVKPNATIGVSPQGSYKQVKNEGYEFDYQYYRTLNQVQKIFDKFNDDSLSPYSSLKIRFKMKTLFSSDASSVDENTPMPKVQVGVFAKDWNETPNVSFRRTSTDSEYGNGDNTNAAFNNRDYTIVTGKHLMKIKFSF